MLQHLQLRTLFFVVLVVTALGVGHAAAQDIPLRGAFAGIDGDFNGVAFPIGGFSGVFDAATAQRNGPRFAGRFPIKRPVSCWCRKSGRTFSTTSKRFCLPGGMGRYTAFRVLAEFTGFINLETGAYVGWINGVLSFD